MMTSSHKGIYFKPLAMELEYARSSLINLSSSSSLIPNNLCVARALRDETSVSYGVVHKGTANIVHVSVGGEPALKEVDYEPTKDKDPMAYLTQVKWCHLKNKRTVLVLTSYKGFQLLEWDGTNQLYLNKFETPHSSFVCRCARGVASVGDLVCIGTSEGPILMLNIPAQGSAVTFTRQLKGHTASISDLATNSHGQLASSDESGCIMVWPDPLSSSESSVVVADASEVPCVSLCFCDSLLIGGFTNGQIVIYNSESGAKMVEISAHARCINGLDVAPDTRLLLSVSEDCTASVWRLPTHSDSKVAHLFSTTVSDTILCGGRFCDSEGSDFVLSGFDTNQLITFTSKRLKGTSEGDSPQQH